MNRRGELVVYSGPSGVGKGTLLAPLIQQEDSLVLSISATTRLPRPGEIDGTHYHFVSKAVFEQMIENDEMLEYAQYNGNFYGTPKQRVEQRMNEGRDIVLEIEVQGARQIKEKCPDALMIFVMPPSFEELRLRLCGRNTEDEKQMTQRLETAKQEIAFASDYDFIIINDCLETARVELLNAIKAGKLLSRRNINLMNEVLKDAKT